MRQAGWIATAFTAVFGGWLIVMPGAVVALSLRFAELDRADAPLAYSVALGAGWLVLVVALVLFGRLSDRLLARGVSRALILVGAVPVSVLCAWGLWAADAVTTVAAAWIVAQVAAAAIIAPSLALIGDVVPTHRRGWASAIAGALSTLALFVGVLIVRVLHVSSASALAATVLIGGVAAIPLMLKRGKPHSELVVESMDANTRFRPRRAWLAFIIATLLVAWCISTANSYVVLFIDRVSTIAEGAVASTATNLVALATGLALVGTALGGALSRSRRSATITYATAAVGLGLAVAFMVVRPTANGLLVGALVFGFSTGVFGGAQLAVALFVRTPDRHLGHDLGVLNAAASLPHVLVPSAAAAVFTIDVVDGLRGLFVSSAVLSLLGAVVLFAIALVRRPHTAR